jgi:uncharacterized protein (TIGR03492 family)
MNTENRKILFISNGHGEDEIACSIIKKMLDRFPVEHIIAFPLVGKGGAYKKMGLSIPVPVKSMPSGGMVPENYTGNLFNDFRAGLARLTIDQIRTIKSLRPELKCVVAVGDVFPVLMAGLFTGMRTIFIGTAKSSYFDPYGWFERCVFKKFCSISFPRDEVTAENLRHYGIKTAWMGNAMMDSMNITDERFDIPENRKVIALLPGSRDFAYKDFPVILKSVEIIDEIWDERFSYIVPLAGSIDLDDLNKCANTVGFALKKFDHRTGLVGVVQKSSLKINLLKDQFGTAINLAHLVIGQAGTGNEQAAGLGKPVISFDSGGREKLGWYRARQKGLLGDSLAVVSGDPESIAGKAIEILKNNELYKYMSEIGKARLGPSGAAKRMADYIIEAYITDNY